MATIQKPIIKAEYTDPSHNTAMVLLQDESTWHMIGKFTHPDVWGEMLQSQVLHDYQPSVMAMPQANGHVSTTIELKAETIEPQSVQPSQPQQPSERIDAMESNDQLRRDIADLQQIVQVLTGRLDRQEKAVQVPPLSHRELAREAIRAAGRMRRAASAPHGDTDPALALNLATISHLAKSGQEGAFTELARLAEARGVPLWQDVAEDVIKQADAAMRVAVRSYAIETRAMAEIDRATGDDQVSAIRDAAVATIKAIGGEAAGAVTRA